MGYGGRFSTAFWRTFDRSDRAWGPKALRHEVLFQGQWAVTEEPSIPSSEILAFDEADVLSRLQKGTLTLRNRVEGRKDSAAAPAEIASLLQEIDYFPRPEEREPSRRGELWGNLRSALSVQLPAGAALAVDGQYRPARNEWEIVNTGIFFTPLPRMSVGLGDRFVRDEANAVSGNFHWALTEKWEVDVGNQYEARKREKIEERYLVRRRFHKWILEGSYEIDEGKDNTTILFSLLPEGFADRPFTSRTQK